MVSGRDFITRLRGLSEFQKKLIVWGVTILLGVGLLVWWFGNIKNAIEEGQGPNIGEQLHFNELQERLQDIPVNINGEQ